MNSSITLYLIRGCPGAGKSTFAKHLLDIRLVEDVHEADAWFLHNNNGKFDASKLNLAHIACQEWTKMLLKAGKSVAVSNTSTTEKEVEVYRLIAEQCNANFISLIVENRHNGVNIHSVPEEKVQQMKDRFSVKL